MADLFRRVCLIVLTPKCYETFFVDFNLFHGPCLKSTLSKCLGIGIVAGSILVKVPQIIKILNSKSAEGISFLGVILELFAVLSNVAYSFVNKYPFSTYGDGFFLLVQTSIIGAMVLLYGGSQGKGVAFMALVAFFTLTLCSGIVPVDILWTLQAMNIPIVFSAKMIQAMTNYRNGSTGQLSAVTVLMLFAGSTARIFTSIQETGDPIIIVTYIVATFANAVITAQLVYYWNVVVKPKKE